MAMQESNYEDFRRALKVDFLDAKGDLIFDTEDELKLLMARKGYKVKKDKDTKVKYNEMPSDKQINFAWSYLKGIDTYQKTMDNYTVHTYNKRIVRRANQETIVKGKKYRKGQFLPKW